LPNASFNEYLTFQQIDVWKAPSTVGTAVNLNVHPTRVGKLRADLRSVGIYPTVVIRDLQAAISREQLGANVQNAADKWSKRGVSKRGTPVSSHSAGEGFTRGTPVWDETYHKLEEVCDYNYITGVCYMCVCLSVCLYVRMSVCMRGWDFSIV
jgi:hypothetical protein